MANAVSAVRSLYLRYPKIGSPSERNPYNGFSTHGNVNNPDNAATSAGARCSSSFKKNVVANRANPRAPCTKYTTRIATMSHVNVIPCQRQKQLFVTRIAEPDTRWRMAQLSISFYVTDYCCCTYHKKHAVCRLRYSQPYIVHAAKGNTPTFSEYHIRKSKSVPCWKWTRLLLITVRTTRTCNLMGPEKMSSPSVWLAFLGSAPPRISSSSSALSARRVSSPPLSVFLGLCRDVDVDARPPPHPPRIRKQLCLRLPCWRPLPTTCGDRLELVRAPSARPLLGCLVLLYDNPCDALHGAPHTTPGGGRNARDPRAQDNKRYIHGIFRIFIRDYATSRGSRSAREQSGGKSRERVEELKSVKTGQRTVMCGGIRVVVAVQFFSGIRLVTVRSLDCRLHQATSCVTEAPLP